MRQKKPSILTFLIALICIAVYVSAVLIAAYRIYLSVNERQVLAEREFFDLADLSSAAGVLGFMDTPFREAVQDRLGSSQTLRGVIISGPNGEYAFERTQGSVITWVGESPRFSTRFGISATPFFTPLRIEGMRNVTISAVASYIDYDVFIAVMKRTLLAVLIALSTAFITLLVETIRGKDRSAGDAAAAEGVSPAPLQAEDDGGFEPEAAAYAPPFSGDEAPEEDFPDFTIPAAEEGEFSLGDEVPEEEPLFPDFPEPEFPEPDFPGPDFSEEEIPEPVFDEAPETGEPALRDEEIPGEEGPRGLYSPETRIGWEDYTLDRLAAELHRCASFEQDLTLVILQCRETPGPELYRKLAERTVGFFNLRDLIFERRGQGITVILPNVNLERGFSQSEEFHSRILGELAGYLSDPRALCVGISSRSGRLVDAERLLYEASQALAKALSDPVSPIVAFKSDPEKYRSFIQRSGLINLANRETRPPRDGKP
jgi:hypothetical protein